MASRTGIGAHIYSAAENGPRGRGGLTAEELSSPDNCIWLCAEHASTVDKNRGQGYPPEELLAFKALQEARTSRERQGLYVPIGWIFEVSIREAPLFKPDQKFRLAKLNLIVGENRTGKTALAEWIAGSFDPKYLKRWQLKNSRAVHLEMQFLNPSIHTLQMDVNADQGLFYRIDRSAKPFNPMSLKIFHLGPITFAPDEDQEQAMCRILNMSPLLLRNLFEEVQNFRHAKVRNLCFKREPESGHIKLYSDVSGTVPGLSMDSLSGREVERIFIELVTAAARISGEYAPTLLVLDGCPSIIFDSFFKFYSHHFLDPDSHFQTILCIPTRALNLQSARWNGWEIIRTTGQDPNVELQ